jgi:glucokinase
VTVPLAIGLDAGGTKALGVAIDAEGNVVEQQLRETPNDADALIETFAELVGELGDGPVGVGVPGLVTTAGVLVSAPNLINVRDLPVAARLQQRLGRPVAVDNDNTLSALAEWKLGAGRGASDMLLVGLGTGIGGGVVAGGQLQRGVHGFAGEFGHVVVDPDGPSCPCGRRGCWERYASGSGLARLARLAADRGALTALVAAVGDDAGAIRGEDVTAAAAAGDPEARAVIAEFAGWVALGLVNLTYMFDPEVIVISGGLSADPDQFLPPIRAEFERPRFAGVRRTPPEIRFAQLGPRAGAVGAALLARERN